MNSYLVLDLVKLILPTVVTYLVWLTKSVLRQKSQLNAAFTKIRALEKILAEEDELATCLTDCQRKGA